MVRDSRAILRSLSMARNLRRGSHSSSEAMPTRAWTSLSTVHWWSLKAVSTLSRVKNANMLSGEAVSWGTIAEGPQSLRLTMEFSTGGAFLSAYTSARVRRGAGGLAGTTLPVSVLVSLICSFPSL